jgi:hypothetical protein
MTPDTSQTDETLLSHLDRLESVVARKDIELAQSRTESVMKDVLIKEMQSALDGQAALLGKLTGRVEELERRLSATRIGI